MDKKNCTKTAISYEIYYMINVGFVNPSKISLLKYKQVQSFYKR